MKILVVSDNHREEKNFDRDCSKKWGIKLT